MSERELEILKTALESDIIYQKKQLEEISEYGGGDIRFEIWLDETEKLHRKISQLLFESKV